MPADYKVVSVTPADVWEKDYGQGLQHFQSYDLVVEGPGAPNIPVSLNRKMVDGAVPADKIPTPDSTLYLEITGTKAKAVQRPDESYQSASNGSSGAVRTDVTGTSIEAQVAAKCTADVLVVEGKSKSQVAEQIEFLTLAFFDAIQKAKQPEPIVGGTLQPPSDPEAPGPPVTPTPSDQEIPFRPI